jgi:hypothetical protein
MSTRKFLAKPPVAVIVFGNHFEKEGTEVSCQTACDPEALAPPVH